MEHRLISGGFEYLPFARNCISNLKRTGLLYASQSFEIGGVSINVRIANGQEFIRIDGQTTLMMDSGVVDLGNIGADAPDRFLPGKLFATDYYKTYTIGFTKASGDWLTNPSGGSVGQVAGKLTYSSDLKGKIHPDEQNCESFMPALIPEGEPNAGELSIDDEALYAKKILVATCPASMFTGKCRLWVQAMYGRPMYKGGIDNSGDLSAALMAGRPWLKIKSFNKDDNGNYAEIGITTNCGVFLDPATGDHWLIDANENTGTARPLVSSGAGELLRKRLKLHLTGKKPLSAQDAEHLEAFILSDCRPDASRTQTFTFTATKPVWSLGYGWHWNWSGTKANFVCNELFLQSAINETAGLRSTHYQLEVSFSGGKFSAMSSIVRGPSDWTMVPSQWCILEPDWLLGTASKLQPSKTHMAAGGADFYAYYDRDQLVTCSVDVIEGDDSEDNTVDMSDRWTGPYSVSLGSQYGYTVGMRDGYYTAKTAGYGKYYKATFDLGKGMSGDCYYHRSWVEETYSITDKAITVYPTTILYDYGYITAVQNIPYGYPPYEYASVYGTPDTGHPPTVEYEYKHRIKNVSFYSYAHIIVPFGDAEAIASHIESHRYDMSQSAYTGRYATQGLQVLHRPKIFIGSTYTGTRGDYLQQIGYGRQQGNQSPIVVTPEAPEVVPDTDTIIVSESKLFAASEATDAVIDDRIEYSLIAETNVPIRYEVASGVQEGSDSVVISRAVSVKRGISHECTAPTVVGWV